MVGHGCVRLSPCLPWVVLCFYFVAGVVSCGVLLSLFPGCLVSVCPFGGSGGSACQAWVVALPLSSLFAFWWSACFTLLGFFLTLGFFVFPISLPGGSGLTWSVLLVPCPLRTLALFVRQVSLLSARVRLRCFLLFFFLLMLPACFCGFFSNLVSFLSSRGHFSVCFGSRGGSPVAFFCLSSAVRQCVWSFSCAFSGFFRGQLLALLLLRRVALGLCRCRFCGWPVSLADRGPRGGASAAAFRLVVRPFRVLAVRAGCFADRFPARQFTFLLSWFLRGFFAFCSF